jgi:hypothetical protein
LVGGEYLTTATPNVGEGRFLDRQGARESVELGRHKAFGAPVTNILEGGCEALSFRCLFGAADALIGIPSNDLVTMAFGPPLNLAPLDGESVAVLYLAGRRDSEVAPEFHSYL